MLNAELEWIRIYGASATQHVALAICANLEINIMQ